MNIRPKTIRRVSILLVIILIVGGGVTWFWLARTRQINRQTEQLRVEGLKAYFDGDYKTGLEKLEIYTRRKTNTGAQYAEALYAYGVCRSKIPTPDGSYIEDSINIFRKYTLMVPKNLDAKRQLLEMESPSPMYAAPAISLANELLQQNPQDLVALKALAVVYLDQRRYQEALDAAAKYTQLNPTDLELQQVALAAMKANGNSGAEMRRRADDLAKKYPNDPRFMIVQAFAYENGISPSESSTQRDQERDAAVKLVLTAAKKDAPDVQFVKITASILDQMQKFNESLELLQRATAKMIDPDLERMLIQRLWQTDRYADVVNSLGGLDPASPQTNADLIAFKAMSLYSLKKTADADALVTALAARTDDAAAACWAVALKANYNSSPQDPKALIAQYQDALKHNPNNPYVRSMLANSYRRADQTDLALQEWRTSAKLSRGWAYPYINIAEVLTATGQGSSQEAMDAANFALLAGKTGTNSYTSNAVIADVMVDYAHLQTTHDPAESASLLGHLTDLQKATPGEPNTLPMYVDLLAQNGNRDKAISAIQDAQKQTGPGGENLLLKLVAVSRKDKLGLEKNLYDAIEHQYGMTPRLAYARAMEMVSAGNVAGGLKLLQDAKSKGKGEASEWDSMICIYREATHDPGAAAAWKALGDANPNDLNIQSTIVNHEDMAWTDRDFMDRSIDRLKALDNDEAGWKLGRARWLLESKAPDKDAPQAIVLLTEVVQHSPTQAQPHELLAIAYERLAQNAKTDKERQSNLTNAVTEWNQTAELLPKSPQTLYHLMHALNQNKQITETQNVFDKFAALPEIPSDLALHAAIIMNDNGYTQRAEKMLLAYPKTSEQSLHDATLAKVYRRENRVVDAANLYFKLAGGEKLDVMTIGEAADFFGAHHDLQAAHKFLDHLDDMQLPPGEAHRLLANFDELYAPESAAKEYQAAMKAAPSNVEMQVQQISYLIRQQLWSDAQTSVDAALAQWPDDARLPAYKTALASLPRLGNALEMKDLLQIISRDPQNPAANQTLAVLTASPPLSTEATVQALNDLVNKYPNFQPLYGLTISRLVKLRRTDQAVSMAAKGMAQFPNSPDAARMASEIFVGAKRWSDALDASRQWRLRATDNPVFADSSIAAAQIFLGQAREAVNTLAPYIPDAKASPEQSINIILQYADALIRAGSESDATALLLPLAQKSSLYRIHWLNMAVGTHPNAASSLAWIEQVHPLLQADSFPEQKALGESYFKVGQKFNDTKAFGLARDTFKPWVGKSQMDEQSLLLLGAAASHCNDNDYAEKTYRNVLATDAHSVGAENGLADLLLHKGDAASLKEAETFARESCNDATTDLDKASCFDTLARIQAQQGRDSDAIASFEQGTKLRPNNVSILVGLAGAYTRNKQIDKATRCLIQIDSIVAREGSLSSDLTAELQLTRDRIKKATSHSPDAPATSSIGNGR